MAKDLGEDVRRLRLTIKRIERDRGVSIIRKVGSGKGARYYVTVASLRKHLPEMFDEQAEVEKAVRERLEEVQSDMEAFTHKTLSRYRTLAASMKGLRDDVDALRKRLEDALTCVSNGR